MRLGLPFSMFTLSNGCLGALPRFTLGLDDGLLTAALVLPDGIHGGFDETVLGGNEGPAALDGPCLAGR